MVKLISWIILAPLAIAVVAFSVSNRTPVTVEVWPLPFTWELPLFLVVLAGTFVGFVIATHGSGRWDCKWLKTIT